MISAVIIAVLFRFGDAHAQQNNTTAENSQTTDDVRRAKAFDLLESLAGQINTLQSAENRARLGSNISESLWSHDEKRARTLLVSVEEDIKAGLQNPQGNDPTDIKNDAVFLHLRVDTVKRIAKHDPDLALAFLNATEPPLDVTRPAELADIERTLELQLAKEIIADSPEMALKLGRQSLARGFSDDLLALLTRLKKKHRDQAQLLYKEIVLKLRNTDLSRETEVTYFALNLVRSFAPPAVDELTFRDLINIFITSALANGCGTKMNDEDARAMFCNQIGSLVPLMAKIDPSRAARLKQWAPEDNADSEWSPEGMNELTDVSENGTVDEILALLPKYPQMEPEIYWRAWERAQASGDLARARKIAMDYRGDPEMRREMLVRLDRAQTWAAMNDEKLEEVQRALVTIPWIQERLTLLLYVANQIGTNDPKKALKLLDQASAMVDTMKPGREQTHGQMALAAMYCSVKNDRGLAIMESLLPKINELVAAAARLDGYDHHYLRDGEWNMSGEGSVGDLLTGLVQNAGYFAFCDFDRAVSVAAQFERPELRLMAQMKLAQGILAGPPKRSAMVPSPPRY